MGGGGRDLLGESGQAHQGPAQSIFRVFQVFQRNESQREKSAPAERHPQLGGEGAGTATWVTEPFVSENGPLEGKSIPAERGAAVPSQRSPGEAGPLPSGPSRARARGLFWQVAAADGPSISGIVAAGTCVHPLKGGSFSLGLQPPQPSPARPGHAMRLQEGPRGSASQSCDGTSRVVPVPSRANLALTPRPS